MRKDWLWDRNITEKEVKSILSNPKNKQFISICALLLNRNNSAKEIFNKYISPVNFCRYWYSIKKKMRKDKWSNPRIEFWQAIYEKIYEKLKEKGINIKNNVITNKNNEIFRNVGNQIREIRLRKNMTQKEFAKKIEVSQQIISRIEKGRQNISLGTLKNIVGRLGADIKLEILEKNKNV